MDTLHTLMFEFKVTSAALLIMAFVTTPVCPRAAPRASPGKMYLVVNTDG